MDTTSNNTNPLIFKNNKFPTRHIIERILTQNKKIAKADIIKTLKCSKI